MQKSSDQNGKFPLIMKINNFLFSWLLGNVPKNAYYPFGGGPRICIGQKLASIELKLALLEITRHFWIAETPNTGVWKCLIPAE